MTAKRRRFRSLRTLGSVLVGFLVLDVLLAAAAAVVRLLEVDLLQRIARGEFVSFQEADRSDDRVAAFTIVAVVVLVVTGIVWVVWQHRGQANLHAVGLREITFSPGWAVGWWLIPFANLVKPFQTVRELWKASGGDERWWQIRTWPVIGWWWALWITAAVLNRAAAYAFTPDVPSLGRLISGSRLFFAGEIVSIVAAVLAIAVVRAVNARQAGLVQVVADRTAVPTRPDVPQGNEGQNP